MLVRSWNYADVSQVRFRDYLECWPIYYFYHIILYVTYGIIINYVLTQKDNLVRQFFYESTIENKILHGNKDFSARKVDDEFKKYLYESLRYML